MGDDGLIQKAEKASEMQANAEAADREKLSEFEKYLTNAVGKIEEIGGSVNGEDTSEPETPEDFDDSNADDSSKVLVGYSYNGTILPALPEWDKETYPYASIAYISPTSNYYINCTTAQTVISSDGTAQIAVEDLKTYEFKLSDDGLKWEYFTQNSYSANQTIISVMYVNDPWTNYDILNADGTVYLAASEPIPVYE